MNVIIDHLIISENEFAWTAPKRSSWRFVQPKWMVYTLDDLWSNISLNLSFRPVLLLLFFFLPVTKHCQSTFCFSLNLFTIHLDANYVCPSVKNLTLSTCLLSFVCDSILNREKVHNILIFAKFLSYSVGEMLGGGGYFLGISTLKQTLTLVILPCEILSKSDLIYQEKKCCKLGKPSSFNAFTC